MSRQLGVIVLIVLAVQSASTGQTPPQSENTFVVEKYTLAVVVQSDGSAEQTGTLSVRILTEPGIEQWATLPFPYSRDLGSLDIRYVRVRKPNGNVVETPVTSAIDVPTAITSAAPEYSDLMARHVNIRALGVGDVLEYQFVTRQRPIFPGHFCLEHEFLLGQPVADGEMTLSFPTSMLAKVKSFGDQPTVEDRGGRRIHRWTFRRERAFEAKDLVSYLVSLRERRATVQVTTFESWTALGDAVLALWKDRAAVTPAVRQKAQELTATATTEAEKIQAIYTFVAEKVRYVSISFGVGRLRPHSADETLLNGFGDCKDKHVLIEALLSAVGIRATAALIAPGLALDAEVPSPAQFTHVVTAVARQDGATTWVDGTISGAPAGYLDGSERDRSVLLLSSPGSAGLARTPAEVVRPSTWTFDLDGEIDAEGTLIARVTETLAGDHEVEYRASYRALTGNERLQRVKYLAFPEEGATVSDVTIDNLEQVAGPLIVKYSVQKKNAVAWSTGETRFTLPALWLSDPEEEGGTLPVASDGFKRTDRMRVQLLPGFSATLSGADARTSAEAPVGTFTQSAAVSGRTLTIDRQADVRPFFITTEGRADYAKFRTAARTGVPVVRLRDEWPWGSTTVVAIPDPPLGKNPEANALLAQTDSNPQVRIAGYRRGLELEPDHPSLWGTLGTAHVGGARIAEATEAYTKQIAVAPSLWSYKRAAFTLIDFIRYEESLPFFEGGMRAFPDDRDLPAMYAETLLMLRQNDRAEAVVRTEVLKRPRSARLHMTLGRAQMRLGRTTEGIAALKRAVTIENGPNMLNAAARELLAANVELELAFDYAGQAVSRTASQMEGYTNLASLPSGATTASGRMAAYMETLGRLLERRGDRGRAKAYCDAAWRLAQRPLSAECLARVAEAEGDAATAARLSTVAQSRLVPSDPTAPWESPRGTVEEVARLNVEAFAVRRAVVTQTMPRPDGAIGSVRATLLVDGMGVVRQVTTPEGAAPAIRGALMNLTIGPVIPDRPDVRLRRIATVACTADAQTCTLTFDREIARTGV